MYQTSTGFFVCITSMHCIKSSCVDYCDFGKTQNWFSGAVLAGKARIKWESI